jgi:hypothetical protein
VGPPTSLAPALFIEVIIQSHESEQLYICVCKGYRFCLVLQFGTAPAVWYFLIFILLLLWVTIILNMVFDTRKCSDLKMKFQTIT